MSERYEQQCCLVLLNCVFVLSINKLVIIPQKSKKMDMLSTLPRHLDTKNISNDANGLNVTVPAAAAAAFQLSTNFLNAVSIAIYFTHKQSSFEKN